jgi:succinate dehydrogenase flavin-adding protein (antitoxin of CptAB toxin-antitoxin module)
VAFDRDELHRKSCDYASTVDRHVREEGKFLRPFVERCIPQVSGQQIQEFKFHS